MGCDIHLQVERRVNGIWERVETLPPRPCTWCDGNGKYKDGRECYKCKGGGSLTEPFGDRTYDTFTVLAGVRGEGTIEPISEPRGLPEDCVRTSDEDGDYGDYGDHSFSWLLLSELQAYKWNEEYYDEGFVKKDEFKAWDYEGGRNRWPASYSKGIYGPKIIHVTNADMRRRIEHPYPWEADEEPVTLVWWNATIAASCKAFLQFMESISSLGAPEDVRIVFGFDS